ncbi:MAG TPA: hypothetical protein VGL56_09835 [Fimbriimonadaceae bacterium]|jgi:hypothetical protein
MKSRIFLRGYILGGVFIVVGQMFALNAFNAGMHTSLAFGGQPSTPMGVPEPSGGILNPVSLMMFETVLEYVLGALGVAFICITFFHQMGAAVRSNTDRSETNSSINPE